MKMEISTIIRNVAPSITVMVVGLMGAYFVYNIYFSDRVATGFAGFEPAAGEELLIDPAEMIDDETVLEEEEKKDIMDEIEAGIKSLN